MTQSTADVLSEAPDEPVVHWMERPPLMVAPATVAGALGGVFLLGLMAGIGLLALMWAGARNED